MAAGNWFLLFTCTGDGCTAVFTMILQTIKNIYEDFTVVFGFYVHLFVFAMTWNKEMKYKEIWCESGCDKCHLDWVILKVSYSEVGLGWIKFSVQVEKLDPWIN